MSSARDRSLAREGQSLRHPGRPDRRVRPALSLRWSTAFATIVGFAGALGGLGTVIDGAAWWFVEMAIVAVVIATTTIVTIVSVRAWVPAVAAAAAGVVTITFVFASDVAVLGILPTPATVVRFGALANEGTVSIVESAAPAPATSGIIFLLAVATGVLASLAGFVGIVLGRRGLVGVPLLVVLVVPGFVSASFASPIAFAIAAGAWLVLVFLGGSLVERRKAGALGTLAVVIALLAPVVLEPRDASVGPTSSFGLSTGVNPIIKLGEDLRRPDPIVALRYRTTATVGLYMRLTTLDRFTGRSWSPAQIQARPENTIDVLGPVPGLDPSFGAETITTSVDVGNILGGWLPTPYPARSVTGVEGRWYWEPNGLSVRTIDSSMRGQTYSVESLTVRPTADELRAAPRPQQRFMNRDTILPEELPPIVAELAAEVTATATNDYDRAMALQNFFRGATFSYSETAPVQNGYDGSGAAVLGQFLEVRRGYCVHFASAMAVMARSLGIPARLAVGFQPGLSDRDPQTNVTTFAVSSNDLHAWPELYFEGYGWIRFEPTPGRGQVPNYESVLVDDPSTPTVDESLPSGAPRDSTTAPVDASGDPGAPDSVGSGLGYSGLVSILAGGVPALLMLAFAPALFRRWKRAQRLGAVRRGSALAGWIEVLATATDVGITVRDVDSPRASARRLPQSTALDAVVDAVEREVFARPPRAAGPIERDNAALNAVSAVRSVTRSILAASNRRRRLRAQLLPASLDLRLRRRIRAESAPVDP